MAISIKDKFIREAILDENGKQIGEIKFNPEDTATYTMLINIMEELVAGHKKINEIEIKDIDQKLETIEDFEKASDVFAKIKLATQTTDDMIDNITKELDGIFGVGTCDLFMQGSRDAELVLPLLNGVLPFFKNARKEKTQKYKRLNPPKKA